MVNKYIYLKIIQHRNISTGGIYASIRDLFVHDSLASSRNLEKLKSFSQEESMFRFDESFPTGRMFS